MLGSEQREHLCELLARQRVQCERLVPISSRAPHSFPGTRKLHPPREGRLAKLAFAATTVRLPRPRYASRDLAPELNINVVHVREIGVSDVPIEWILFISEPVASAEDILRVVDIYRSRWTIEEYFKALKTGCSMEERQLESLHSLTNAEGAG